MILDSLLSSIVNFAVGNAYNSAMVDKQNKFNAYQAEVSRDFSHQEAIDSYNRNLEADSTKYQRSVQDMAAAGLNPALIMTGGTGISAPTMSNTAQSATAQGTAPISYQPFDLSSIAQMIQAQSQAKLTDAQVDKIKSETDYQAIINRYADKTQAATLKKIIQDTGLSEARTDEATAQAAILKKKLPFVSDKEAAELAIACMDRDLKTADLESYDWRNRQVLTEYDAYSQASAMGYNFSESNSHGENEGHSDSNAWSAGAGVQVGKKLGVNANGSHSKSHSEESGHSDGKSYGEGANASESHS